MSLGLSALSAAWHYVLSSSNKEPLAPNSLKDCATYAMRNPDEPVVISMPLRKELQAFYGTAASPIEQDPLKPMTGAEYIRQLGQASERVTWAQLQVARQARESELEALIRLRREVPGLPSYNVLYDVIKKTVIDSKTPILRYFEECYPFLMGPAVFPPKDLNTREGAPYLFGPQEMLARTIANADPETIQPGMLVPIWTRGRTVHYEIASQLHKDGLHAYFLTPISHPDAPAQMLFRGAKSADTTRRILDTTGVGKTVFDQCVSELTGMWKTYATPHPRPRGLVVSGWSLGAVDAQRFLVELSKDKDATDSHSFEGFFFSSPKLDESTWNEWKPIANCELYFAQRGMDPVTWVGSGNIHIAGKTRYYLASSPSSHDPQDLHTRPFFPKGTPDRNDLPQNLLPESTPDWESSQMFTKDSQTSFQNLSDKASVTLDEWSRWTENEAAIARSGTGSTDPSTWLDPFKWSVNLTQ